MTQPSDATRSLLFSPLTVRGMTAPNRIMLSPLQQYAGTDGGANDRHLVPLGRFAMGGAGMVIAEATAIEPAGRMSNAYPGLWSDDADIVAIGREMLVDPNWSHHARRVLRGEGYDDWPREAGWWLDKRIPVIRTPAEEDGETPLTRYTARIGS